MATFAQMKAMVAAYMQRSQSSFVSTYGTTTVDLLSLAINAARKHAELSRNFEQCRVQTELDIDLENGSDISGMTLLDGVTAVRCKSIAKAFLPVTDSDEGWFPIDVITREKHVERVARYYSQVTDLKDVSRRYTQLVPYFAVVRLGDILYLTPADTTVLNNVDPVTVRFDIYKWLSDYNVDSDTDFLLTHCWNYMQLASVQQLNFYLKDDQRVPVSDKVLEKHWHSVVAYDSNLVMCDTSDANLD